MKKIIIIILAVCFIVGAFFWQQHRNLTALNFSNTQTWSQELRQTMRADSQLIPGATKILNIPPPPSNTSKETNQEIAELYVLAKERPERQAEIVAQIGIEDSYYADIPVSTLFDYETKPHTTTLVAPTHADISGLVFYYKNKFDRVRPSYLDQKLTTSIPVPAHPAYPSGHATQSYFIALVLSDIMPAKRTAFIESAKNVARNREVAGVHYRSDSTSGQMLAQQYYDLLKETEWYQTRLEKAKTEWQ